MIRSPPFSKDSLFNSTFLNTDHGDSEDINKELEVSFGDSANSVPRALGKSSHLNKMIKNLSISAKILLY